MPQLAHSGQAANATAIVSASAGRSSADFARHDITRRSSSLDIGSEGLSVSEGGGAVVLGDNVQVMTFPSAEGTFQFGPPFEYGTAGAPIPNYFTLTNVGPGTAGLEDGMTLSPPFGWTDGDAFPGGSGTIVLRGATYDFCSSSLAPQRTCVMAVSYTGATTGSGTLTINLGNSYWPVVARELHGISTTRAMLTVSQDSELVGCADATCGPVHMWPGGTQHLLVTNRGAMPTTSLGVGTPLDSPFYWGGPGDIGDFPGGTGTGSVGGQSYEYCTTQTLGVGQQCMVTLGLAATGESGPFATAADVAYSDAVGPVLPHASRDVVGNTSIPTPPP